MTAAADIRADSPLDQGFQLGELRIAPQDGEVSGPGGREQLDPKVMGVLLLLAEHAGHVVSREDLLSRLWPNAIVTDDVLSRCIYELRQHLSQAGGDEQLRALIETVPKRGYRLTGEVTALHPARQNRPVFRYLLVGAAVLAAIAILWFVDGRGRSAKPDSIAVLPFVDMSEGQDHGYLADGISEEILNRLAQSEDLRVIARTSSFAFRDRQIDIREIARALNVSHVLEGSVRRSNDNIRITAQLIAASDSSHVWSETFDREFDDMLEVQDQIAAAVASALHVELDDVAPSREAPVVPAAYERFLRARFFYNRRSPGDIERSIQYFEEALAIDPGYAAAWAALAGAYALLIHLDNGLASQFRPLQGAAAQKAVMLAPDLAVARARLAQYYLTIGEYETGEQHFEQAVALDPDEPLVMGYSSERALWRGDLKASVEIWRQIVERDPLSPTNRLNLAVFLSLTGNEPESSAEFRRALEFNPDLHWHARFGLVRSLVVQKRYPEAAAEVAKLPEGEPRDHGLALLHELPGRREESDAALARLAARPIEPDDVTLAEVYAFRGLNDKAIAELQAARNAIERSGDNSGQIRARIGRLQSDMVTAPTLQSLSADPRWAELMADRR